MFRQRLTVLVKNKNLSWVFAFSKCSSDELSSLLFLTPLRWKHIGAITFIGDISAEFSGVLGASYWFTA
jgi:hypothetical protein